MWERLSGGGAARVTAQRERMAALKQAAQERRAEYAAVQQGEGPAQEHSVNVHKKQVEDAEGAYAAAVQAWDNIQWRLKSR